MPAGLTLLLHQADRPRAQVSVLTWRCWQEGDPLQQDSGPGRGRWLRGAAASPLLASSVISGSVWVVGRERVASVENVSSWTGQCCLTGSTQLVYAQAP